MSRPNFKIQKLPPPTILKETVKEMEKICDHVESSTPPAKRIEEAINHFMHTCHLSLEDQIKMINGRQLSCLACGMTSLKDSDLLYKALQLFSEHPKGNSSKVVFQLCCATFDMMNKNVMRQWALNVLPGYKRKRRRLLCWKENRSELFNGNGPSQLASRFTNSEEPLLDEDNRTWLRTKYFIPEASLFHRQFIEIVIRKARKSGDLEKWEGKLVEALRNGRLYSLEETILDGLLYPYADIPPEFDQTGVFGLALEKRGDPRKPENKHKWKNFSDNAVRAMTRWLAARDITFFFDKIAMDSDRRNFWRLYIPHLRFTKIVLGLSKLGEETPKPPPGTADLHGRGRGVHACILDLGKLVVVVFNRRGDASMVYPSEQAPFDLYQTDYSVSLLKNTGVTHKRIIQRGGKEGQWQRRWAELFEVMYGIPILVCCPRCKQNNRLPFYNVFPEVPEYFRAPKCGSCGYRFEMENPVPRSIR